MNRTFVGDLLLFISIWTCGVSSSDLYVSHDGHDEIGCGDKNKPCASIRYAVSILKQTESVPSIYVNGSGAPYTKEGGTEYILMSRSLNIIGVGGKFAVIQCVDQNQTKLFKFDGNSSQSDVVVTVTNVAVRDCRGASGLFNAVMMISNARLRLTSCEFIGNDLLLLHRQTAQDGCEKIDVTILNSVFKMNFAAKATFQPGITLSGCSNVKLQVENTRFLGTTLLVHANEESSVQFFNCTLDGSSMRGSSLSVFVPGEKVAKLSMSYCNVTGHRARVSAVALSIAGNGSLASVKFNECRFYNNQPKTLGSALSIVSTLRGQPFKATRDGVGIHINKCVFANNSAADVGGAVYLAHLPIVRINGCSFTNSSGLEGGAVYLNTINDASITNTQFLDNRAVKTRDATFASRGGALFVENSAIQLSNCSFRNNKALADGSEIFMSEMLNVVLDHVSVEGSTNDSLSAHSGNALMHVQASEQYSTRTNVHMMLSNFTSRYIGDQSVLFIQGQVTLRNVTTECGQLSVKQTAKKLLWLAEKAPRGTPYELLRLQVWCELACNEGSYATKLDGSIADFDSAMVSADVATEIDEMDVSCPYDCADAWQQNRTKSIGVCLPCPAHTRCSDAVPVADLNYYGLRHSDGQYEAILCPFSYCRPNDTTMTSSCTPDRSGVLCTSCAQNWSPLIMYGSHTLCKKTSDCLGYGAMLTFIICTFMAYFVSLLFLHKVLLAAAEAVSRLKMFRNSEQRAMPRTSNRLTDSQENLLPEVTRRSMGALDGDIDAEQSSTPAAAEASNGQEDDIFPVRSGEEISARQPLNSRPVGTRTPAQTASGESDSVRAPMLILDSVTAFFLAVAFFYQLVPIVYPRIASSTQPVDRVIKSFGEVLQLQPPLSAIPHLCHDVSLASISSSKYFIVMSLYWTTFVVLGMLLVLLVLFFHCSNGPFAGQNVKMITTHFGSALLFFLVISYVPLLSTGFNAIPCVAVNNASVLYTDTNTPCYQPWQKFAIIYLAVCIAPLCAVLDSGAFLLSKGGIHLRTYILFCIVPALGLVWIPLKTWHRSKRNSHSFVVDASHPLGLRSRTSHAIVVIQMAFIRPYRNYFKSRFIDVGWLTVVLSRNFLICLSSSLLVQYPVGRTITLTVILFLFTVDHLSFQWLSSKLANYLETYFLVALSTFSALNLLAAANYESESSISGDYHVTLCEAFDWVCRVMTLLPIAVVLGKLLFIVMKPCFCRNSRAALTRPM